MGYLTHDVGVGEQSGAASVACLQGEGTAHIEVYGLIAYGFNLGGEVLEFFETAEDELWRYGYVSIVFGVDVAAILGAYVASLYTYEGGIVAMDATN